mmetsp:Transcript_55027/g.164821  ORF Transcript_55027/g.164821 Transcript_55027/m.164821 type:complete len:240 (+) Transcript_55027:915-1634(+)
MTIEAAAVRDPPRQEPPPQPRAGHALGILGVAQYAHDRPIVAGRVAPRTVQPRYPQILEGKIVDGQEEEGEVTPLVSRTTDRRRSGGGRGDNGGRRRIAPLRRFGSGGWRLVPRQAVHQAAELPLLVVVPSPPSAPSPSAVVPSPAAAAAVIVATIVIPVAAASAATPVVPVVAAPLPPASVPAPPGGGRRSAGGPLEVGELRREIHGSLFVLKSAMRRFRSRLSVCVCYVSPAVLSLT